MRSIRILTRNEATMVALVNQGYNNKTIGYKMIPLAKNLLPLTEGTIKAYLTRIGHKIHLHDRMAMAKWWRELSILEACLLLGDCAKEEFD